jgi:flagellar basal-body rod modification protein FlgD
MALGAVSPVSGSNANVNALGLDLQSLLKIILTQLTYQDPLKPVDNFEFVSQLAQFTSLEQTRQLNENIGNLLSVQASTQSIGLLGRTVDVLTDSQATLSGVVQSVSFSGAQPAVTIRTTAGQTLSNISLSQITQVR